jgi:hypothetical protein
VQHRLWIVVLCGTAASWLLPAAAEAQFEATTTRGPQLDKALTQRIKIGMTVTAVGGPCARIVGSAPVPTDWPEQRVRIADEQTTPNVKPIRYRTLDSGVKQMVVDIPQLRSGEQASAFAIFEVTRYSQLPPANPGEFRIPDRVDREMSVYLGPSPYIESRHPNIMRLAREVSAGLSGWEKVEALYDAARERVEYKEGALKGALRALHDGTGDCEELASLFIAMCRAEGIPARTVWVPGHCYSEFYLVDSQGNGHWFPCQSAGTRAFGGIPEHRPILQKGDNFRDPDRPKDRLRYVSEFLKGAAVRGGGRPEVKFFREVLSGAE